MSSKPSHMNAVFLTHRRGGFVAVFPASNEMKIQKEAHSKSLIQHFGEALSHKTENLGFDVFQGRGVFLAKGSSTTAEVLNTMYTHVLTLANSNEQNVSDIYVGIGPGSFTGLRLGCAFVNGLNRGRKRRLWALENSNLENLKNKQVNEHWVSALPDGGDDEFGIPITLLDFYFALEQIPFASEVDVLRPAYGRLPGPVLKLQQEQN